MHSFKLHLKSSLINVNTTHLNEHLYSYVHGQLEFLLLHLYMTLAREVYLYCLNTIVKVEHYPEFFDTFLRIPLTDEPIL